MKANRLISLMAACLFVACQSTPQQETFNVVDFGAIGDGSTDCTEAFNSAIAKCSEAEGVVIVPAGSYVCSTIHMLSNVELRLEKDSEILGNLDPETYDSFIPQRDMSQYNSGDGTVNSNTSTDARWNRALILANQAENISITGEGTINGRHVFDPLGEEFMRGPHGIIFGDCENVVLSGVKITCASNYAFMGYGIKNGLFTDLSISEGWDGIHIRGGENILITDCSFETGDDSIAGGFWYNMEIKDCYVNSSCNGLRMIMPADGVDIHDCTFEGPGHYPHRTSKEQHRTNMLFGVVFEPSGWGPAPGDLKNLKVHDCTMINTQSPVAVSVSKYNHAYDLTISDVTAKGTYASLTPVVNYNDTGFDKITVNNYTVEK